MADINRNGACKSIMFQGTSSHVGKSLLTAALCRILNNRGVSVAPFKSQNMALNSFVTLDGAEIGRAQAFQAQAARVEPTVDMNPILLKPTGDSVSQVIVHGKVYAQMGASEYHAFKKRAMQYCMESFTRITEQYEAVVIEGAGSPAEINLRDGDIANMGLATAVDSPVVLIGDIDRGGVFASIIGTLQLLSKDERARIKGFIINKFRGERALLKPAIDFLEEETGLPVLGIIPYFDTSGLPDEDGVALSAVSRASRPLRDKALNIAVVKLPRISNFTDFDALQSQSDVDLFYVNGCKDLRAMMRADLVILPGTKNIISDLDWLLSIGFNHLATTYLNGGGRVFGVCGGFQMLGSVVSDPLGVEGAVRSVAGLGLLDMETVLKETKHTWRVEAVSTSGGVALEGYEIHMGATTVREQTPFATIISRNAQRVEIEDGAISKDGRVQGSYIHGLFDNDAWRGEFLNTLRAERGIDNNGSASFKENCETAIDSLANLMERNCDIDSLLSLSGFREHLIYS